MPSLPELFRPISDQDLKRLEPQKLAGTSALAVLIGIVAPLEVVLELTRGAAIVPRAIAVTVLNVGAVASVLALARRRFGKANPDLLLLALAALLFVDLPLVGWVNRVHHNDLLVYAPIVPLITTIFVPWRPTFALSMVVPCIGSVVLGRALGSRMHEGTGVVVFAAVAISAASAVAAQLQRKLWLELEKTSSQLFAGERMSTLGRMTAGIAHELKTPLAATTNSIDTVRGLVKELGELAADAEVHPEDVKEIATEMAAALGTADSATKRATRFVAAIRAQTVQMTATSSAMFSVSQSILNAVTLLEHTARRSGVAIDTTGVDGALIAEGDQNKLSQIITNLVKNGLDACGAAPKSKIVVRARRDRDRLLVEVEDNGPGIPAAIRGRIFEALFTTKAKSDGTGLGLAISRDIAEGVLGGTLVVADREDGQRGARFVLSMPLRGVAARSDAGFSPAQAA